MAHNANIPNIAILLLLSIVHSKITFEQDECITDGNVDAKDDQEEDEVPMTQKLRGRVGILSNINMLKRTDGV